jgi:MerR family transcriptional regulator/heat shock protein HspR
MMRTTVRLYGVREVTRSAGITRRTLRLYEELGLVEAVGVEGERPLYAEDAIETIARARRLQRDLGVNLAGVQVILDMRERLERLQGALEAMRRYVQAELPPPTQRPKRGG